MVGVVSFVFLKMWHGHGEFVYIGRFFIFSRYNAWFLCCVYTVCSLVAAKGLNGTWVWYWGCGCCSFGLAIRI